MHEQLADKIIKYLHESNPDISIALSGSVADGTYNENSDIDLLIVNKDFNNSFYIYFCHERIKIGIFSYHKKIFWQENLDYLYHFHNMRLSYIHKAQIRHDPYLLIKQFKNNLEDILQRKALLKEVLISELKMDIEKKLNKEYSEIIDQKEKMYEVLNNIICIFFLRKYTTKILNKQESLNPYEFIKKIDIQLYLSLKKCFPVYEDSKNFLRQIFMNYIIINY